MVAQIDAGYRRFGTGPAAVRLLSYMFFEGRPITSRGRWFNPVVLCTARCLARFGPRLNDSRPVFIIGTGRSGTTILGTALSLHHDVGFLNEPKALWYTAFPGEDIIGNYAKKPGKYVLTEVDLTDFTRERFKRLYGSFLKLSRRKRVIDKYPEAIFRIPFLLSIFPHAKFIWLTRNGNDTIASIAQWSKSNLQTTKYGKEDWWGLNDRKWEALTAQVCPLISDLGMRAADIRLLQRNEDRAAVEWIASVVFGLVQENKYVGRLLRISFEDLMGHPRKMLQQIFEFCGLESDPRVLEFAESTFRPVKHYDQQSIVDFIKPKFRQAMLDLEYVSPDR